MTNEELAAIETRANAATVGPWRGTKDEGVQADATAVFETGCGCCTPSRLSEADAMFIAHARTDIPALVAEVRRLKELVRLAYLEGVWSQTHPEFSNADQLWLQSDAKASIGGDA